jgi:hypothetical protein
MKFEKAYLEKTNHKDPISFKLALTRSKVHDGDMRLDSELYVTKKRLVLYQNQAPFEPTEPGISKVTKLIVEKAPVLKKMRVMC